MPVLGTRPQDGLCPNTPQNSAGTLIEPPMSGPTRRATLPIRRPRPRRPRSLPRCASDRTDYWCDRRRGSTDSIHSVSSEVLVTPRAIAPASISRCTAGALPGRELAPSQQAGRLRHPGQRDRFLDREGDAEQGWEVVSPGATARRASAASASARARSNRSATSALTRAAQCRWRSMCASTTSRAVSSRSPDRARQLERRALSQRCHRAASRAHHGPTNCS